MWTRQCTTECIQVDMIGKCMNKTQKTSSPVINATIRTNVLYLYHSSKYVKAILKLVCQTNGYHVQGHRHTLHH